MPRVSPCRTVHGKQQSNRTQLHPTTRTAYIPSRKNWCTRLARERVAETARRWLLSTTHTFKVAETTRRWLHITTHTFKVLTATTIFLLPGICQSPCRTVYQKSKEQQQTRHHRQSGIGLLGYRQLVPSESARGSRPLPVVYSTCGGMQEDAHNNARSMQYAHTPNSPEPSSPPSWMCRGSISVADACASTFRFSRQHRPSHSS